MSLHFQTSSFSTLDSFVSQAGAWRAREPSPGSDLRQLRIAHGSKSVYQMGRFSYHSIHKMTVSSGFCAGDSWLRANPIHYRCYRPSYVAAVSLSWLNDSASGAYHGLLSHSSLLFDIASTSCTSLAPTHLYHAYLIHSHKPRITWHQLTLKTFQHYCQSWYGFYGYLGSLNCKFSSFFNKYFIIVEN